MTLTLTIDSSVLVIFLTGDNGEALASLLTAVGVGGTLGFAFGGD